MEFNPSKCQVRVTTARVIINTVYLLHGQVLEVVTSAKYSAGPSPGSGMWSGGGKRRMPKVRESGLGGGGGARSTKGGFPPLVRGFGRFPPSLT